MPIRFQCRSCRQILSITSRKAGMEVNCPKCGAAQCVPDRRPTDPESSSSTKMPPAAGRADDPQTPTYDDIPMIIDAPGDWAPAPPVASSAARPHAPPVERGKATPPPLFSTQAPPARSLSAGRLVHVVWMAVSLAVGAICFVVGWFVGRAGL